MKTPNSKNLFLYIPLWCSFLLLFHYNTFSQFIDPTFNIPKVLRAARISDMAVYSDGKIILGGDILSFEGQAVNGLLRLSPDGSLDDTFSFANDDNLFIIDVELQSTGDIIVAGNDFILKLNSSGDFIASLNMDLSFWDIKIQSDDKILLGGGFTIGDNANFIRFNSDLTEDIEFNSNVSVNSIVTTISTSNDKIVIGGVFTEVNGTTKNNLARINADGTLDNTLDPGLGSPNGFFRSMVIGPNGKIYLSEIFGNTFNGVFIPAGLARLNSDGSVDNTFSASQLSDAGQVVKLQGGKILLTSRLMNATGEFVIRLNANGSIDDSFDWLEIVKGDDPFVKIIDDGFLLASGSTLNSNPYGLAKFSSEGVLDANFSPKIEQQGVLFAGDYKNGQLILGGDFLEVDGVKRRNIVKLNEDGSVDEDWSFETEKLGLPEEIKILDNEQSMIAIDDDLYRLQQDGSIDESFNFTPFGDLREINDFELFSNGQIMILGFDNIYRINNDGSEDPTFDAGASVNGNIGDIAITSNQQILFGGSFSSFNGSPANRLVRLNDDATLDPQFDIGSGPDRSVSKIVELENTEIVIAGSFGIFDNTVVPGITKLSSSGVIDNTFADNFADNFESINARNIEFAILEDQIVINPADENSNRKIATVDFDGILNQTFTQPEEIESLGNVREFIVGPNQSLFVLADIKLREKDNPEQMVKIVMNEPITSLPDPIDNKISSYPNPVNDVLILALEKQYKKFTVMIYDHLGRSVSFYNELSQNRQNEIMINVNTLRKGNYVLRFLSEDGSASSLRFLKE